MSCQIIKKLCPAGLKNNPNKNLRAVNYITIHCTGNYGATATAQSHANYLFAGSLEKGVSKQASWQYTVDEKSIYQSFEDNQACWHAADGNGDGNMASIGIEICVNNKVKFPQACDNAAWLTAQLLKKHNLTIDKVVQHNKWSGKNCPAELRSGAWGVTWNSFIETIRKYLNTTLPQTTQSQASVGNAIPITHLQTMVSLGIMHSPDYWKGKTHIPYLDNFVKNAVAPGKCDRRILNGIVDSKTALNVLKEAEIAISPDYWKEAIYQKIDPYLEALIINTANHSRDVLERLVWAEARGEGVIGQELVANVILNRTKSKNFPDGVYNVVFAKNQFSPVADGSYQAAKPTASEKQAVTNVLNGKDNSQGATYFCTKASAAKNNWHERALKFLFEYGNHRFYIEP